MLIIYLAILQNLRYKKIVCILVHFKKKVKAFFSNIADLRPSWLCETLSFKTSKQTNKQAVYKDTHI